MKKYVPDCMTSELLFEALSCDADDEKNKSICMAEYNRRLEILKLTEEQKENFKRYDEHACLNGSKMSTNVLLAATPVYSVPKDYTVGNLTLSELLFLANAEIAHHIRSLYNAEIEDWDVICIKSIYRTSSVAAEYARFLMYEWGFDEKQRDIFIANEFRILKLLWYQLPMGHEAWK